MTYPKVGMVFASLDRSRIVMVVSVTEKVTYKYLKDELVGHRTLGPHKTFEGHLNAYLPWYDSISPEGVGLLFSPCEDFKL